MINDSISIIPCKHRLRSVILHKFYTIGIGAKMYAKDPKLFSQSISTSVPKRKKRLYLEACMEK